MGHAASVRVARLGLTQASMVAVEDYAKALADYGEVLADGIVAALPGWVSASVTRIATAWAASVDAPVTGAPVAAAPVVAAAVAAGVRAEALAAGCAEAAVVAGQRAALDVGASVRALLGADLDEQRSTPLSLVRAAVRYPTEVLRAAGVPPVERDGFETEAFPEDDYGLTPATLADLDPALGEVAIAWGAAKAWEHRRRHLA